MINKTAFFVISILFSISLQAAESTKTWLDALELYDVNNPEPAKTLLIELANQGDLQAQISLGTGKFGGHYLPMTSNESLHWLEQAALQDYAKAQYQAVQAYWSKVDDIELFVLKDRMYRWLSSASDKRIKGAKGLLKTLKPSLLKSPKFNSQLALLGPQGFNQWFTYITNLTCSCSRSSTKIQCVNELSELEQPCLSAIKAKGLTDVITLNNVQKLSAVIGQCINAQYVEKIKALSQSRSLCIYTKNHSKVETLFPE